MGEYINPPSESKEAFLERDGEPVGVSDLIGFDFGGSKLPVVLVNNGGFTAAGIAYDRRELQAFLHPDPRPKQWFLVEKEKLSPYINLEGVN